MPRNSFGVYSLPAGNPVVADTIIESGGWANPTLSDIGSELTGSLPRNGSAGMTAALKVDDGVVAAPGLSFVSAANTGMWKNGSGIAWSIAGTKRVDVTTTGLDITGNFTVSGTTLLTGAVTFSGSIAAVNGVFSGNLTAVGGTYSGVQTHTTNDGRGIEINRNSAGNLVHLVGFPAQHGLILSAGARYDSPANWVAEDTKGSALVFSNAGALPAISFSLFTGGTLGAVPPWQTGYGVALAADNTAANTPHHIMYGSQAMLIPVGTTPQRPAVPQQGDMRYNSTLSVAEIYTGSAWVAIFTSTNGEKRNFIINGGYDVWQRNTTFANPTTTVFYTADRWGSNRSGDVAGMSVFRQALSAFTGGGSRYQVAWQRTPGDTSVATMAMYYTLETADSVALAGKTVTFSLWALKGATYSGGGFVLTLIYGTGTDQRVYAFTGSTTAGSSNNSLTTSWARYTVTAAIPTSATEVGVTLSWTPSGTAGATDYVVLAQAQLEVGAVATDYMSRPFQQELALCQRYYEKTFNYATVPVQAAGNQTPGAIMSMASGTTVLGFWAYKVSKRTIPTITTYNPTQANANWRNTVNTADTAVSIGASGENSCVLQAGAASDIVGYQINVTADAEL